MLQVSSAHQQVQQWVLIYAGRLLPSLAATTVGACSMNYTPESAVTKEHAPGTCPWYISSWCAPKRHVLVRLGSLHPHVQRLSSLHHHACRQ